jgi:hypothetical protein
MNREKQQGGDLLKYVDESSNVRDVAQHPIIPAYKHRHIAAPSDVWLVHCDALSQLRGIASTKGKGIGYIGRKQGHINFRALLHDAIRNYSYDEACRRIAVRLGRVDDFEMVHVHIGTDARLAAREAGEEREDIAEIYIDITIFARYPMNFKQIADRVAIAGAYLQLERKDPIGVRFSQKQGYYAGDLKMIPFASSAFAQVATFGIPHFRISNIVTQLAMRESLRLR